MSRVRPGSQVGLTVASLSMVACFTVPIEPPGGAHVRLLPGDAPVDVFEQYRTGSRRPVEPVAGAEGRALGAQQDHAHVGVRVGGVDGLAELVAQLRRDGDPIP